MIKRERIYELVAQELKEANEKYPLFRNPHEAFAVLLEEVEEMGDDVCVITDHMRAMWKCVKDDNEIEYWAERIHRQAIYAIQELIQVAAMCEKIKQSNLYGGEEK